MRPIRLEVQGLTSYRQAVSVDFSDLDLFAITGPTGSGKSSLIDAMTFALYGKVPRVGNRVRDLISHGADRLKVTFYFSVGDTQYRIYRETARKGAGKPPQIEHYDSARDAWVTEDPSRVRDLNEFVENMLLLNYESFIRSVLLPQGAFQEFLAGDPIKRREVLDRLLQLAVYSVMQQRANSLRARHDHDAESIRERLATELADATPAAVATAKAELKSQEDQEASLAKLRAALESACAEADRLVAAKDREAKAREEAGKNAAKLEKARETLTGGEQALADLDRRIAETRKRLDETGFDPDLRTRLTEARGYAQQRDRLTAQIEEKTAIASEATKGIARIAEESGAAKARVEQADAAVVTHQEILDGVRRANIAIDLRTGLKVGDLCPVCGEPIARLPQSAHGDLDRASADLAAAEAEKKAARDALADVQQRGVKLQTQIDSQAEQLEALRTGLDEQTSSLHEVLGDGAITTATIAARLNAQESARRDASQLESQVKSLAEEREAQSRSMAAAQNDVATLGATVEAHQKAAEEAADEALKAGAVVRTAATKNGWEHVIAALDDGREVAGLLRRDLSAADGRRNELNQSIGSARARIVQIEANIALAEGLRADEQAHHEKATLAKDLASMLRTDQFPAFIRDSVMRTLAAAGSEWLRKVSGGRYDLKVEGQDFEVADLWNAGEERGVRTLSGGETFLASLALALALAELLPTMSGEADSTALQSLFIDEGFSHLDEETLNTVAGALEVLGQDRRRLIGVITHVPALAERMPARIVVHKTQQGSTVSVE